MSKRQTCADKPSTVYAIRCKENGKMLVGVSTNVESAVKTLFYRLNEGKETMYVGKWSQRKLVNTPIQDDFNSFKAKAFEVYILEEDIQWMDRAERKAFWIEEYQTNCSEFGYNISNGYEIPDAEFKRALPPKIAVG